jgi:hypothetical protein
MEDPVTDSMGAVPPLADESGAGIPWTPSGGTTPTSSGARLEGPSSHQPGGPRVYDGHPAATYRQPTRAGAIVMGAGILGLTIGFFLALVVAPRIAEWLA